MAIFDQNPKQPLHTSSCIRLGRLLDQQGNFVP
ncbi:hypothetical protein CCACVL1_22820 [Corchorus capsularis]|uniref:Uncharacterized protein n=1 Tax=Corchorus capsularis TaxID=210143 RepID=A0A1R3GWF7_COCAP|nr:hypothetical protein CCACVL1_22820 [Corchorus capsularis]